MDHRLALVPMSALAERLSGALGVSCAGSDLVDVERLAVRLASARWALSSWLPIVLQGDDLQLYLEMGGSEGLAGTVLVVSEATLIRGGGGLVVGGEQLASSIGGHLSAFGEALFNGDTALVALDAGLAVLYHHSGRCCTGRWRAGVLEPEAPGQGDFGQAAMGEYTEARSEIRCARGRSR